MLPMPAQANVARKNIASKFAAKNWFSGRTFYITIADVDIGSKKSLHTLFVKHLDHILVNFEQNRMVRTIQNFEVFHGKWLTIFDKGLTPFWMTFL